MTPMGKLLTEDTVITNITVYSKSPMQKKKFIDDLFLQFLIFLHHKLKKKCYDIVKSTYLIGKDFSPCDAFRSELLFYNNSIS